MKKTVKIFIIIVLMFIVGIEKINASTSIGSYFGDSSDPQNHRIEGTDYFGTYGTNIYTYFKRISHVSVDGNKTPLDPDEMRVAYCSDATKGHATTTNNVIYWSNCEPIQTNNKELVYILATGFRAASGVDFERDFLITQMAVWYYTNAGNFLDNFPTSSNEISGISDNVIIKNIQEVIDKKNKAKNYNPSLSLSIDSKEMTPTSDGKYYISKAITLNGQDLNSNITITLSGISNAFVSTDSNATSGTTSFTAGSKIYIKVPADIITSNNNITLKASANATIYSGTVYQCYRDDGSQSIIDLPDLEEKNKELTASLTVTANKNKVIISKTDITGAKEVPGATLVIKQGNTPIKKWVSETTSEIIYLAPGTYTLEEISAPDGYKLSTEKITFKVNSDNTITINDKKVDKVLMKNEPYYVNISKLGIDNKILPGATLKITDKEGKLEKDLDGKSLTWITTEQKEQFHLGKGTYYLTEEKAPDGYIKNDEVVEFTVDNKGTITINNKEVEEIKYENIPLYVYISKKSINGKTELPGATLKITDKEGKLEKDLDGKSLTWITTTKEERFHLAPGTYVLTEIEAPKGYELSDKELEFTVTEDGKILFDKQEAEDNLIVFKNTPEAEQKPTGSAILYIMFVGLVTAISVTIFVLKKYN